MVERQSDSNPERAKLSQLHSKLVNTYQSHLDFLETVHLAEQTGDLSGAAELAGNYSLLTKDQQRIFNQSLYSRSKDKDHLKMLMALDKARQGDFSLSDEILQERKFLNKGQLFDNIQRINFCVDLAEAQQSFGLDQNQVYRVASQVAKKIESEHLQTYINELGKIAKSLSDQGLDSEPVLSEIEQALKRDRRGGIGPVDFDGAAKVFAQCGLFDKALELSQKGTTETAGAVLLMQAFKKLDEGDVAGAIQTVKKRGSHLMLAKVLAKGVKLDPTLIPQAEQEIEALQLREVKAQLYLDLAKAAPNIAQARPWLDKVLNLALDEENVLDKVYILSSLAKAHLEIDGNQKQIFTRILELADHFYQFLSEDKDGKGDKTDLFDAIDGITEILDTAAEVGCFDEIKEIVQHLSENDMLELFDSCKYYAQITLAEARDGLSEEELTAISQEQISKLSSSRDQQLLEALGYFNLISEDRVSQLKPETAVAIRLGLIKRSGAQKEDLEGLSEAYQQTENPLVKRIIIEGLISQKSAEIGQRLYALLDRELSRDRDPRDPKVLGRLLKGLIEIGDRRGKEIATKIFMDESYPEHLRMYLARKLCDSGHWDKQIIRYFQNYRAEGREAIFYDIKLETLSAIIRQMHMTPSLEIYKVLEQARLKKERDGMLEMANFGNRIFLLPDLDLKDKINIFSFWGERYQAGEISLFQLESIASNVQAMINFYEKSFHHPKDNIKNHLIQFYTSDLILSNFSEMMLLLKNDFFPTRRTIEFIQRGGEQAFSQLLSLKHETESGRFSDQNPLQKDLEFIKYLLFCDDGPDKAYQRFINLEFVSSPENLFRRLTIKEMMEAEAASLEAAKLYWMIRARVEAGRRATVIGNQRYGDYFVVEPLRTHLQDLGVQISFFKIGSSGAGPETVADIFPVSFVNSLIAHTPDVVIVDGSKKTDDGVGNSRFPASLSGYYNFFLAFNEACGVTVKERESLRNNPNFQQLVEKIRALMPSVPYNLTHWFPYPAAKVNLGGREFAYHPPDLTGPNVILTNPVIDPKVAELPGLLKDHQPGFLDDPDQLLRGEKVITFTSSGLRQYIQGHEDEAQFVNSIQMHMIKVLPKFIRETDPAFR